MIAIPFDILAILPGFLKRKKKEKKQDCSFADSWAPGPSDQPKKPTEVLQYDCKYVYLPLYSLTNVLNLYRETNNLN